MEETTDKVMSLWDHLGELRSRLLKSMVSVLIIFLIAFSFADHIINFLKDPLIQALPEGAGGLHFTGPMEVFLSSIKVSIMTSLVFGAPFWLYHFWMFIEPALYKNEKRYVLPFAAASTLLFLAGVSFCFLFILPMALDFLIDLGVKVGTPIITVSDYFSMLFLLILGFGLVFETPVLIVLLAMLDLIDAPTLRQYRKFVLIATLIVAAILTPPDPISQIAMAIPTYLMYEMSIGIVTLIKRSATNA